MAGKIQVNLGRGADKLAIGADKNECCLSCGQCPRQRECGKETFDAQKEEE